ncbi:MAG: sodium:alanine symporter family protein [Planctomycetota bacterium]|nr:MAG: sodium:alanine symporter family protein [Planctomycetota bacterium]
MDMNGNGFIKQFNAALDAVNGVIWHNVVLYAVLGVGVLFTLWTGFCQYRALTHGVAVTRGKYDDKNDPGAINHFQALSAALSATVGLGNIAGVAVAIVLGGPGAVFWMWMVGIVGMALKTTEVTLSMIYRNTDDPENPHGGPMFVASKGFAKMGLGGVGKVVGGIFVITLLISTITGGNMFQAWNVADITNQYFGVPQVAVGIFLSGLVGMVIIGGIKRIGAVAGRLVPFMCGLYLLAALYVLGMNFGQIPDMLKLIVVEAFSPTEAQGAFLGGTAGYALLWGMKRALFSSEAGQGSSPIAHSAAKTDEPVREGIVAGLEPFIDTIVVCTLTSLVILSTGVWNRSADLQFVEPPAVIALPDGAGSTLAPAEVLPIDSPDLRAGVTVFTVVSAQKNKDTGLTLHKFGGKLRVEGEGDSARYFIDWTGSATAAGEITLAETGAYFDYKGATLTAKAFDSVTPGLGMWLVTFAAWLFALSTAISWSYYGEQGVVYLFGLRAVMPYKLVYCLLIIVASVPQLIATDAQLDNLTALGTGVMLWANIPIMLVFGAIAMRAYHDYFRRLKRGEMHPHTAPPIADVIEGHDVE